MDVHPIYCDNHFMMYVSQVIMLCTLNLYNAVCQYISIKLEEKNLIPQADMQILQTAENNQRSSLLSETFLHHLS